MCLLVIHSYFLISCEVRHRQFWVAHIYEGKRPDTPNPDAELHKMTTPPKVSVEKPQFPTEFEATPPFGRIHDKLPFKLRLEAGKKYSWCSCGYSKHQVWHSNGRGR